MLKWGFVLSLCLGVAAMAGADLVQYHAQRNSGNLAALSNFSAPAWTQAPSLPFRYAALETPTLIEGGNVKFLWNEEYLFVFADMIDSDIVQEADKDGEHFYRSGDVLEIFIRPAGAACYWELYVAPNGHLTTFFYPSRGRLLPSCFNEPAMPGYQAKIELDGTFNNYADRDHGWRCIAAIPMKSLAEKAGALDFRKPWLVQVARYNYSVYLDQTEYSQIGITTTKTPNYHEFKSWINLFLEP